MAVNAPRNSAFAKGMWSGWSTNPGAVPGKLRNIQRERRVEVRIFRLRVRIRFALRYAPLKMTERSGRTSAAEAAFRICALNAVLKRPLFHGIAGVRCGG